MQNYNLKFKIILFLIIFFGIFGLAKSSLAADYYIAQTAQGDGTALFDCTHAKAINWNWINPNVIAGDTVHLCGTFTSTLAIPSNGSAGNHITVLFEVGAKFSKVAWGTDSNAAIYASGKKYITIDGGTNGIIECIDNGDSGSGLGTAQAVHGISIISSNNIEIKNLLIKNIFIHSYNVDNPVGIGSYFAQGIHSYDTSNFSIHNNIINNAYVGIFESTNNGNISTLDIYNNTITSCSTSIVVAQGNPGRTLDAVNIHNNDFTHGFNWYDTPNANHIDGVHVWSFSSTADTITNLKIYSNYFHGNATNHSSGYVYLEYDIIDPLIYDNIFSCISDRCPNMGSIAIKGKVTTPGATSPKIYNNTMIGLGTSNIGGNGILFQTDQAMTPQIYNNIFKDQYVGIFDNQASSTMPIISDNNIFYNNYSNGRVGTIWYKTLENWATYIGGVNESHSLASNPTLSTNYSLLVGSSAINAGTNLSSLGITTLNSDYIGTPRGSTWDIGAYEYISSDTTPPASPTGLAVN